ncbi:unnamed protein product [Didymodactylos carnosus]|uniref:ADP ribosyltransferase domain-containing protein n=1 Tax=Didymodactylos carnosus TaxID=1234261 RepID=A0A814UN56_9BILA|nr:unnamed protein product [Didymodactylos carnosus]CAF1175680.1 unnamed protein product [Didymodactylos carnosus]CAF3577011.1 unnamed protein product [Didymodactylos carnosus]CAF3939662.1 unnamed protein product [Didymodactylos carnosus]
MSAKGCTANLFDYTNSKSVRDLEEESVDYSWHQLLRDALMSMNSQTQECKLEMLDYCRLYYRYNPTYLKQIDEFECTSEDIDGLYKFRFFIVALCQKLTELFKKNFDMYCESSIETIYVYRGLTLASSEIEQLKQSVGKHISTNGYLSTSLRRDIAETFAANVLFEIIIDATMDGIVYADISQWSTISDDDEFLFDLGSTFRITNVRQDKENKWIMSMIATEYSKNDYIDRERQVMLHKQNNSVSFGHFLFTMGYRSKSIEYFQKALQQTSLTTNDKHDILYGLALAYNGNEKYNLALKCAIEAYEIHLNLSPYENDAALEYFVKGLQSLDGDGIEWIEKLHCSIACVYTNQENYLYGLKHSQQALEITKEFCLTDHNQLSIVHENIGLIYYKLPNFILATEHLKKALVTAKKFRTKNHPDIILINQQLANVYSDSKKYELALLCNFNVLEIVQRSKINKQCVELATVHEDAGKSYCKLEQYHQAIEHYLSLESKSWIQYLSSLP